MDFGFRISRLDIKKKMLAGPPVRKFETDILKSVSTYVKHFLILMLNLNLISKYSLAFMDSWVSLRVSIQTFHILKHLFKYKQLLRIPHIYPLQVIAEGFLRASFGVLPLSR
jgi:hypothetical protein